MVHSLICSDLVGTGQNNLSVLPMILTRIRWATALSLTVVDQIYQRVAEIAATKRQDLRATNSENFPHAKSLYND